ncbi:MAG TPA: porin family protein [Hellea balneolensis]|uniref:Porin family protein n=1 Tax=Hellea balneolensis TaxID=287478 RepID=A0A7C5QND8_9PROT|nr:porin family protein [Hellea balneolensis]
MNIFRLFVVMVAFSGFPLLSHAQDTGTYVGIGVTSFEFDTYGLNGKLGYNLSKNFAVESEGFVGLTKKTSNFGTSLLTSKVNYSIAAYAVAKIPLTEQFEIFARGGYHNTRLSVKNQLVGTKGDIDGFAVGGGAGYNLSEKNSIRLEYTYLDGSYANIDTVAISFMHKF